MYAQFGIKVHYVDTTQEENIEAAITPKTKLIWLETPTNPTLKISDIAAVSYTHLDVYKRQPSMRTFTKPFLRTSSKRSR